MRNAILLAAVLVVAIAPWVIPNSQVLLTIALAKGLAVLGVIILLQAGQVSFGHALFYAVAAYGTAFLGKYFAGGELFIAMIVGTLSAALVGLLVGLFVVRYRHIFFGMLNLAVSMIFFSILEKFYFITGGSDGLRVERPSVLGIVMERGPFEVVLFYVALACAILAMILVHRFLNSPLGNHLRAIKSNEVRLEYLGVSPRLVLLKGYVVSAALCGLGGALMAVTLGVVTPEYAWWVRSGEFVFIAILGGSGSVGGAFVGALVYEGVRTYASAFAADVWQLILGGVLLFVILFAPGGLMGFVKLPKASRPASKSSTSPSKEALSK